MYVVCVVMCVCSYVVLFEILIIWYVSSWSPITQHINSKYEEFLNEESRVVRGVLEDRRVHCCLYFIAPTGHG